MNRERQLVEPMRDKKEKEHKFELKLFEVSILNIYLRLILMENSAVIQFVPKALMMQHI